MLYVPTKPSHLGESSGMLSPPRSTLTHFCYVICHTRHCHHLPDQTGNKTIPYSALHGRSLNKAVSLMRNKKWFPGRATVWNWHVSPCLCGFSPGTPVSSHIPKRHTLGDWARAHCPHLSGCGCEDFACLVGPCTLRVESSGRSWSLLSRCACN